MADDKPGVGQDVGLIEKAFLMGIGAAALAKEKAEELADELITRGTITRQESDSFVKRLADEAEEARRSAQRMVSHETERAMTGMGVASAKDVQEIRDELTEIKALIASMRPMGAGESPAAEEPAVEDHQA